MKNNKKSKLLAAIEELKNKILASKIKPIIPHYKYKNEGCMNPTREQVPFEPIGRGWNTLGAQIWALNDLFELRIGFKNAYQEFFDEDENFVAALEKKDVEAFYPEDPYGHLSLLGDSDDFSASDLALDESFCAYCAGWVFPIKVGLFKEGSLKQGGLFIYFYSGHYCRADLTWDEKKDFRDYLAYRFRLAFGCKQFVFAEVKPDFSASAREIFELVLKFHDDFLELGLFKQRNDIQDFKVPEKQSVPSLFFNPIEQFVGSTINVFKQLVVPLSKTCMLVDDEEEGNKFKI